MVEEWKHLNLSTLRPQAPIRNRFMGTSYHSIQTLAKGDGALLFYFSVNARLSARILVL